MVERFKSPHMMPRADGEFVYFADYGSLQRENAELRAQIAKATDPEYLAEAIQKVGMVDEEWQARAEDLSRQLAERDAELARKEAALRRLADWPCGGNTCDKHREFARAALSGSGDGGWREPDPIKEVKALREALLACRERAESGGVRIETAMDACDDISEIATCALPPEGWQGGTAPAPAGGTE